MKASAYWIIHRQNTPLRKEIGVYENIGRFIIVLLDQSVTITLYIRVYVSTLLLLPWRPSFADDDDFLFIVGNMTTT